MDSFFSGLGRFVVRFRYVVVLVWIAVAVVSTHALPSMSSEVNNNNSQFLSSSAPSSQANTLAAPLLGNSTADSQVVIIADQSPGKLTAAGQSAISRAVTAVSKVPKVLKAIQGATSPDGKAAQINVTASVSASDVTTQQTLISNLESALAQVNAPAGLRFYPAGSVATNVASQSTSNSTGNKTQLFSIILIVVMLLVIFRSLLAPLITLIPSVMALVVSMRFIGGVGAHGVVQISEITSVLLIVLLLGAGTDYGLFFVFRVREEIRAGRPHKEAVTHALVRVGESISASAGTVILALLTLLLASFGLYNNLGIPLAIAMGVVLLAGLTLLPALLAIFGRAVFWPSRPRPGDVKAGTWDKIATRVVRRPAVTLCAGVVIFAALAVAALGYKSSSFSSSDTAPSGSAAATGNALLARHFPQSSASPANLVFRYSQPVWDSPQSLVKAEQSLRSSGQFTALAGPLDPTGQALTAQMYANLRTRLGNPAALPPVEPAAGVPAGEYNAYRATSQFVSTDGRTVQFEAQLKAGGQESTAAMDATPAVRAAVTTAATGSGATDSGLVGRAASLYDVSSAANHDLEVIIPVAVLAIGILLAFALRSLVAPLYLIVSVVLSYLAALGVSTLIFIDIAGDSGLTFILPFLMFVFLLALGEDYNILVMTRIREEAKHLPLRQAVARAVGRTGPTVTSAGLVLAGTFAVLAIAAGGGQITDIGTGLAIGILMDTFLVRALLVPSAAALLGRRNWWPSAMGRPQSVGAGPADAGVSSPSVEGMRK